MDTTESYVAEEDEIISTTNQTDCSKADEEIDNLFKVYVLVSVRVLVICVYLSACLSVCSSIHPSICPSIHPSSHSPTTRFIHKNRLMSLYVYKDACQSQ